MNFQERGQRLQVYHFKIAHANPFIQFTRVLYIYIYISGKSARQPIWQTVGRVSRYYRHLNKLLIPLIHLINQKACRSLFFDPIGPPAFVVILDSCDSCDRYLQVLQERLREIHEVEVHGDRSRLESWEQTKWPTFWIFILSEDILKWKSIHHHNILIYHNYSLYL